MPFPTALTENDTVCANLHSYLDVRSWCQLRASSTRLYNASFSNGILLRIACSVHRRDAPHSLVLSKMCELVERSRNTSVSLRMLRFIPDDSEWFLRVAQVPILSDCCKVFTAIGQAKLNGLSLKMRNTLLQSICGPAQVKCACIYDLSLALASVANPIHIAKSSLLNRCPTDCQYYCTHARYRERVFAAMTTDVDRVVHGLPMLIAHNCTVVACDFVRKYFASVRTPEKTAEIHALLSRMDIYAHVYRANASAVADALLGAALRGGMLGTSPSELLRVALAPELLSDTAMAQATAEAVTASAQRAARVDEARRAGLEADRQLDALEAAVCRKRNLLQMANAAPLDATTEDLASKRQQVTESPLVKQQATAVHIRAAALPPIAADRDAPMGAQNEGCLKCGFKWTGPNLEEFVTKHGKCKKCGRFFFV